jgi:Ca-activated chloride channel family protein
MLAAAQSGNNYVKDGNEAYRNSDYKLAAELYQKALVKEPGNAAAKFNLGNALQKQRDIDNAIKQYDDILGNEKDAAMRAKTYYNKGVALAKRNQTDEAIDAFKQALSLAPGDNDIRENLQKALNEQKQKQQQQQDKQNQKKDKPKQPKDQKQPNKQMMEQKFKELENEEKQLQKQLQKKPMEGQPEKDW